MDILHEDASIGSLVTKIPECAGIFEKLGLDYCCKGNKMLKDACDEKKLNVTEVLETLKNLQKTPAAVNWDQMTTQEIVEHIINTYHVHAKQEMQRISQLLVKLHAKHGQRFPYISELQTVFEKMKNSLLDHMNEEEQIVFPLMGNPAINEEPVQEKVKKHLNSLGNDHLDTGEALEKIKQLTNGYTPPAHACMTHLVMLNSLEHLERNLHEHIHIENQILFPRAKML